MKSLAEFVQIPFANAWLSSISVAAPVHIRVITDEIRVIMFEPGEWAVVYGQAQDAHVVSVEDSMAESIALPERSEDGCFFHDLLEYRLILAWFV